MNTIQGSIQEMAPLQWAHLNQDNPLQTCQRPMSQGTLDLINCCNTLAVILNFVCIVGRAQAHAYHRPHMWVTGQLLELVLSCHLVASGYQACRVSTWQLYRWFYTGDCDNSIFNVMLEGRDAVCSVSSGSYGRMARNIEMS